MARALRLRNSRVVLEDCPAGIVARIRRENDRRPRIEWAGPLAGRTVRALREVSR